MARLKFVGLNLKKKKKRLPRVAEQFSCVRKGGGEYGFYPQQQHSLKLLTQKNDDTRLYMLGKAAWRVAELLTMTMLKVGPEKLGHLG